MKVLFVFPKINSGAIWQVGIAFLSAVLKEAGHEVELFEMDSLDQETLLLERIKESRPGVIGISANSHQYPYAKIIAKSIKESFPSLPILLGGVHPTLFPELIEKEEVFDGLCVGEGEEVLLELVNKMSEGRDYFGTKNFWFRQGKNIIKNEPGRLLENLDKLPYPDRSIFQYFKRYKDKEIRPRFIFSRGCPFNCTYCCNHVLKQKYAGSGAYVRFRSVDRAIGEITELRKEYNFHHIKFDDDTFSLDKNRLLEFCGKFPKFFPDLTFECNVRPGTADEEALTALKKANCNLIKMGVETGNETLRKEVLNRQINNRDLIELFETAKKVGLKTCSFNMVGIPGETKKSIQESINLNVRLRPDIMNVTIFYPYLGTILGERCLRDGLIKSDSADSLMKESILQLPTISKKEIEKAARSFRFNVYKHYDIKKAILEKKEQLKNFILTQSLLGPLVKMAHKLMVKIKLT
ncbi:MAG: radical SAM protein [bacterium]|nr:radical SAM protein [bacterium]